MVERAYVLNAHPGITDAVRRMEKMTISSCAVSPRPGIHVFRHGFKNRTTHTKGNNAATGGCVTLIWEEEAT